MTDLAPRSAAQQYEDSAALAANAGESVDGIRLHIERVSRRYGPVVAVDDLSLAVRHGELVALLGPSGCGKTTTLRLIAGFEPADGGSITIAGQTVLDQRAFVPPERRKVGMVFQDYALFPHLTVAENVAFGVRKSPDRARIVADSLALVGLSGLETRMPGQLSGGQQQRVALARALAPRPDLVLLDEPFSNLDPHLRSQVRDEVRDILRLAGATAVLVTHDQEEALSLADRVAVMFDGRIAQCDAPERVYHLPVSRAVAGFIGDARFLPSAASGREAQTPLGVLPLAGEHHGSVCVLIRPEMIEIDSGGNPGLIEGRVERSRFTGRDRAISIQLESGLFLDVRVRNDQHFSPGERVGVRVRGPVVAYPD